MAGVLAAATLLAEYRGPLLWLSVGLNLGGLTYLLWKLREGIRDRASLTIVGAMLG